MQLNLSQQIAAIIQQGYEGGIQQFVADGGIIEMLPTQEEEILICHPNLSESLAKALVEFASKIQIKAIISNQYNFVGCDPQEVKEGMERLVEENLVGGKIKRCLFMVSPASFNLILDGDLNQDDIDSIIEAIREKVPGVIRGVVGTQTVNKFFQAESKKVILLNDRPQRDRPIGDDDLTNLKISLHGDVDVMDLIKNL